MASAAVFSASRPRLAPAQQQQRCSSSSALAASHPPLRVAAARRAAKFPTPQRGSVVVRADSNRSANSTGLARTVDTMLKRYDFVSTGMGALCVTGWFWTHGQPPLEALSIAGVSTIIALVVNELVFTNDNK